MNKAYKWWNGLSRQIRDSFYYSVAFVGFVATLFTVIGISLNDMNLSNVIVRFFIVAGFFAVVWIVIYILIGSVFKDEVTLTIRQTPVKITYGDIFETPGLRVIGCDSHFDTRIDDRVISKSSLHGRMFQKYGDFDKINEAVEAEADRLGLKKNADGFYDFPLGSVVKYDSSIDGNSYLLVATMKLDDNYEAHTNMAEFERMLMRMWKEIDRVYASKDIIVPFLGAGIARFDDGPKDKSKLLRCVLCTLNTSGVSFNSKVSVLLFDKTKSNEDNGIDLYEYKDILHTL